MCGIAGLIDSTGKINKKNLENILLTQNSRGPENNNIKQLDEYVFFGHNRLKIIDLRDEANQPLESGSGKYTIVFNGEIYNFKEIKKQLLDYNFKTFSDTEVILASLELKGLDWFLDIANGMFSFAIHDKNNKSVILCRDRSGVKPLYYFFDGKTLLFASNPKSIYDQKNLNISIDKSAISEYLSYRYVRTPKSFFSKVCQIIPGSYMTIDYSKKNIKTSLKKYYSLPKFLKSDYSIQTEIELESTVHDLLFSSVKKRLVADVKVGSFLSGGVDSSLIAAMAATMQGNNLSTYTVGTKTNNEFRYANEIAKIYKTDHHEIIYTKDDYFNEWPDLIKSKGGPLGVPNEVPLSLMTRALSDDITVVLSGEGADELFGGYGRIFRLPEHASPKQFHKAFFDKYEYMNSKEQSELGLPQIGLINQDLQNKLIDKQLSPQEFIFYYFQKYHIEGLLQRLDTSTMRWSIEAREPFLDKDLINFVYSKVPISLKLKWIGNAKKIVKEKGLIPKNYSETLDIPKYLLKKVAERYLPKEIIYRKKEGFPIELMSWHNEMIDIFKSHYKNQDILRFNKNELNSFLENKNNSQKIWMINNVFMFLKNV